MERPWDGNALIGTRASSAGLEVGEMLDRVGKMAIKFYYQIKPHSQENASLLGVPPKQYLQVLHFSKLRREAAMNFPLY